MFIWISASNVIMSDCEDSSSTAETNDLTQSAAVKKLLMRSLLQQMEASKLVEQATKEALQRKKLIVQTAAKRDNSTATSPKCPSDPDSGYQTAKLEQTSIDRLLENCYMLEQRLEQTTDELQSSRRKTAKLKATNEQLTELALRQSPKSVVNTLLSPTKKMTPIEKSTLVTLLNNSEPDDSLLDLKVTSDQSNANCVHSCPDTKSSNAVTSRSFAAVRANAKSKATIDTERPLQTSTMKSSAECSRSEYDRQVTALQLQLMQARNHIQTLQLHNQKLESQGQERQSEQIKQDDKCKRLQTAVYEQQKQMIELQNQMMRLQERLVKADQATERGQQMAERAEQRASAAEEQRNRFKADLTLSKEENKRLKDKVDKLRKANTTNENLILWLNKQLTTLQNRHTNAFAMAVPLNRSHANETAWKNLNDDLSLSDSDGSMGPTDDQDRERQGRTFKEKSLNALSVNCPENQFEHVRSSTNTFAPPPPPPSTSTRGQEEAMFSHLSKSIGKLSCNDGERWSRDSLCEPKQGTSRSSKPITRRGQSMERLSFNSEKEAYPLFTMANGHGLDPFKCIVNKASRF